MGDNVVIHSFLLVYYIRENWNNVMMKPFAIVWELFVFGIQALFLYGLAIIFCVGLIAYVIADNKNVQPEIQYIYEKEIIVKEIEKTIKEKQCARVAGCRVLEDGTIEW